MEDCWTQKRPPALKEIGKGPYRQEQWRPSKSAKDPKVLSKAKGMIVLAC
jgi:hypothetical protein